MLVNFSRSREPAHAVAAEIAALGVKSLAFEADVADDAACRAMVDRAVDEFGRLDILVNNAATTSFIAADTLDEVTDDIWRRIFDVNVIGTFHCCRAVREAMLTTGGGHIVNVSSVAAYLGKGSSIPYAASKAAINNLTLASGARASRRRFASTPWHPVSLPVAGCKTVMAILTMRSSAWPSVAIRWARSATLKTSPRRS